MGRVLLLVVLLARGAAADTGPHREGEYGGVVPGQPQQQAPSTKPGRPKRPPPKGTLTWIGFEAKNGGAQVFFQSMAAFEVTQHMEGAVLVVHLSLTRLGQNTWRLVDTRFFDNPIAGIVARGVGARRGSKKAQARAAGIDVRISFKNPKDAKAGTLKTQTEADGMYYAYLDFPEGAEAKAPTAQEPEK